MLRFVITATSLMLGLASLPAAEVTMASATPEETEVSPRDEAIAFLETLAQDVRERVSAYQGRLISEEDIRGALYRKDLDVWFQARPSRVLRLEFNSPDEGQTLVWREDWDHMRVNPPGLIPTMSIDPAGERALENAHRPVTTFGIDRTIERYIESLRATPTDAEVTHTVGSPEAVGSQTLVRHEFTHPAVDHSRVTTFNLWIDPQSGIPIHFENRRADGSLYERNRYVEFTPNPSLDADLFED